MSKGDNSPGISKLAGVFKDMIEKGKDTSQILDFGVIQPDKSLLTNTYPVPIPKSDYIVCRHLKARTATTSSKSIGDHGSHTHTVKTQEGLAVGDRVLVAWVLDDAVVLDVITDAANVL